MSDLLLEKRWVGEFYFPGDHAGRFAGDVVYSAETGILFSYTIAGTPDPKSANLLHGVLSSGDRCTLVGSFSTVLAGHNLRNCQHTLQGKAGFAFFVIGDWLEENERLTDFNFSLTNLQELFFQNEELVKYSEAPLLSLTVQFGKIEVVNEATFWPISEDIDSQIYCTEPEALSELKSEFKKIKKKFSTAWFMLKKNISYRIKITFALGKTVYEAATFIADFGNLFALLINKPVYPESINAEKLVNDERRIQLKGTSKNSPL